MRAGRAVIAVIVAATTSGCWVEREAALEPLERPAPAVPTVPDPVSTVPSMEFEAQLLNGAYVIIRSGDGPLRRFVDGVPGPIHDINELATDRRCAEIARLGERWRALADDSSEGRIASAYARHADNVHAYLQCDREALEG